MISTLHGELPLIAYPADGLPVTESGRSKVCTVRGQVFGQFLNVEVSLNLNTGELLIMSPDCMVGAIRLGDLVVSHAQQALVRSQGEAHAQAH